MRGWLIYHQAAAAENKTYIDWFIHEAKKQQVELLLQYREQLSIGIVDGNHYLLKNGKSTPLPDFAIVRTIEPILNAHLEACGIVTFNNAQTAQVCNHKSWTHLEITKLGIPMVQTFFATKHSAPPIPPLPFPVVVKEAAGRGGKQVYFVQTEAAWKKCLANLTTNDYIVQATDVTLGQDVRVFVIGKEMIGAVLRKNEHDFRANFKLGGKAFPYTLSTENKKMIQKIIDHFSFGLVGIDFLIGKQGELIFNEIEDVVGSRILSEVTDINLLKKYVAFIKQQVNEYKHA